MANEIKIPATKRRDFLKTAGFGAAAVLLGRSAAAQSSPPAVARTKEAFFFTDPVTKREILQLTKSDHHSIHGYYDLTPWSQRDGRIVFTRMAEAGAKQGEIGIMDRDGSNLSFIAHTNRVHPNGGALPQWSSDARRIYYRDTRDGRDALAWVEPDTGKTGMLATELFMICPVGHKQVYHVDAYRFSEEDVLKRRAELAVYLQDLDTFKEKRLTTVEECLRIHPRWGEIANWHLYFTHPKWSPDGSRLFFVFTNEIRFDKKYGELPRVKDIYVINADGSGLRRLAEFGHHPLWHPDGKSILANCDFPGRDGFSLTLIDAETGEQRLVSRAMPGTGHPSFSPDGRWIAVDKVEKGRGSIYIVNAKTDELTLLFQPKVVDHTHKGTHLHPVWSQDSKQLLVASDASGKSQLCVITI